MRRYLGQVRWCMAKESLGFRVESLGTAALRQTQGPPPAPNGEDE